jgi:hypothetical protein
MGGPKARSPNSLYISTERNCGVPSRSPKPGSCCALAACAGALDGQRRSQLVAEHSDKALQVEDPGEKPRVDILVELGRWLPPSAVLEHIERTRSPELVTGLAPYVSQPLIPRAVACVRGARPEERRPALVALAERAEGEERHALTAEALAAALESATIVSVEPQGWADDVCDLLRAMSPGEAHTLLAPSLEAAARGTRTQMMGAIRGLAPELARLGGPETSRGGGRDRGLGPVVAVGAD